MLRIRGFFWGILMVVFFFSSARAGDLAKGMSVGSLLAELPQVSAEMGYGRLRRLARRSEPFAKGMMTQVLANVLVIRAPSLRMEKHAEAKRVATEMQLEAWSRWSSHVKSQKLQDLYLIFYRADHTPEAMAKRWREISGVEFAEPYYVSNLSRIPDDPDRVQQSHLAVVHAYEGWDVLIGQDHPVLVAVVDGGMDAHHPDLAGNISSSFNFATGSTDPGELVDVLPLAVRHGTHVAGIVSAVTNNASQIAGVTWNTPLLAIAANHPEQDDSVIFGYQGIAYAAEHGAKIINCSWGRPGNASWLERTVIEEAVAQGAVIIAAAGNQASSQKFYPAAYPEVMAVANVQDNGQRNFWSNYGLWIDVAAPGTEILSLLPGGGTGRLSGTSMSSPVVSGLAALLWGYRPTWSGAQLLHQIRVSSSNLDALNPGYVGKLGHGLVQADQMLAYAGPGYRIISTEFHDANENGELEAGERVEILPRWINELAPSPGPITVSLTTTSPWVVIEQGSFTLPALGTGGSTVPPLPFVIEISPDFPLGQELEMVWSLSGVGGNASYRDRQITSAVVSPLVYDLKDGAIRLSLAGNGRLGFSGVGGGTGQDGLGIRYLPTGEDILDRPDQNLLFEGALLVGTGVDQISDGARYAAYGAFDPDFLPTGTQGTPRRQNDLRLGDGQWLHRADASFHDEGSPAPLPIRVKWTALTPPLGQGADTALVLVELTNAGGQPLNQVHYGFFLDWDMPGDGDFRDNDTRLDFQHQFATAMASDPSASLRMGTSLVTSGNETVHFRAINNDSGDPENPSWGIYDGFTNEEKWNALSSLFGASEILHADISQVWAGGPFDLQPEETKKFVLVMGGASDDANLQQTMERGREMAQLVLSGQEWQEPLLPTSVGLPMPNPWTDEVSLSIQDSDDDRPWTLEIYDARGRLVRREFLGSLSDEVVIWDGQDARGHSVASGIYFLRLRQGEKIFTRKALKLR